jgi:hypothetical protein
MSEMQLQSRAESFSIEEGVMLIAFDLNQSEAGYLIISSPSDRAADHDFNGSDHHVEMKDESYGRYGGLRELRVLGEERVQVGLAEAVPGVGESVTIIASAPMPADMLVALRSLERPKP